ncbi:hypothetical protein [Glutamicibacter sp. PS]|uniref:hypothetical protein n=1 Tax=Glutamicibacter sp. PS TaxID=3075634 RepID=UPI00283D53B3|nr:hypothetical protein [Glutamicibacter sp. PS]MDR4532695.1 hypothetical protein [Glutamicibacter sp. PS]
MSNAELSPRRRLAGWLTGGLGALATLAGIAIVWWFHTRTHVMYTGIYEPMLTEDSPELFLMTPPGQLGGELLFVLGVIVLGVGLGILAATRRRGMASGGQKLPRALFWGGLFLTLVASGVLLWDALQVRSFGWFGYAPIDVGLVEGDPFSSGTKLIGLLLLAVGLGAVGFALAFRREARAQISR